MYQNVQQKVTEITKLKALLLIFFFRLIHKDENASTKQKQNFPLKMYLSDPPAVECINEHNEFVSHRSVLL